MSKPTLNKHLKSQIAVSEATSQMEALLRALTKAIHSDDDHYDIALLVRAVVPRLAQLNSCAMSFANPDNDDYREMMRELRGSYEPENEAAQ